MTKRVWRILLVAGLIAMTSTALPAQDDTYAPAASQPAATSPPIPYALPQGHPPIEDQAATTQPAHGKGAIVIKAVQKTKGGPDVGGDKVIVEIHRKDKSVQRIHTQLDEHGVVILEDLDISTYLQPVVRVEHSGVGYIKHGNLMGPKEPRQILEVPIYEATTRKPEWFIRSRHLFITPQHDQVEVMEIITVNNPTDRSWLGTSHEENCPTCAAIAAQPRDAHKRAAICPVNGSQKKGVSTAFPLPANAGEVRLGESFSTCCGRVENGWAMTAEPLLPGDTNFQFAYKLPIVKDVVSLHITSPVAVNNMVVFVPADGSIVTADGLGEEELSKDNQSRMYQARQLPKNSKVSLSIQGWGGAKQTANSAKWIAGLGIGMILLAAGMAVVLKAPRRPGQDKSVSPQT